MTQTETTGNSRVGFIGVGVMGEPMAANLVRAGYDCTIYDINPVPLAALGARIASSPAEVGEHSDVLITMVVNDQQFKATLFEPGWAGRAMKPGAVVIGMSTMSKATVLEVAQKLRAEKLDLIDAPVSGGQKRALDGTLTIMAGGADATMEKCRPVLETMGSNLHHVGKNVGDGQAVKIVNQLLVCVHTAAAAEALTLGIQAGLDKNMLYNIISGAAGNSWIFSDRGARMVAEDFTPPKSGLNILIKDIGYVMESASALNQPMPLGGMTQQLLKMAAAQGWGHLDDSIMIKLMELLGGIAQPESSGSGK